MWSVSNFLHDILISLSDERSKGGLLPVRIKKDVKDLHLEINTRKNKKKKKERKTVVFYGNRKEPWMPGSLDEMTCWKNPLSFQWAESCGYFHCWGRGLISWRWEQVSHGWRVFARMKKKHLSLMMVSAHWMTWTLEELPNTKSNHLVQKYPPSLSSPHTFTLNFAEKATVVKG